jgi:hypothetical protein
MLQGHFGGPLSLHCPPPFFATDRPSNCAALLWREAGRVRNSGARESVSEFSEKARIMTDYCECG